MTITSKGYGGTLNELQLARAAPNYGAMYNFGGPLDFQASIKPGVARTVTVAPGKAFGWFVEDTSDTAIDVQLGALPGGQVDQWHAVVIRRNWSTNTTTVTSRALGASAVPMWVTADSTSKPPTTTDDQVIAWARVHAGTLAVAELRDQRSWSSKGIIIPETAELPPATWFQHGQTLRRGSERWVVGWNGTQTALIWLRDIAPGMLLQSYKHPTWAGEGEGTLADFPSVILVRYDLPDPGTSYRIAVKANCRLAPLNPTTPTDRWTLWAYAGLMDLQPGSSAHDVVLGAVALGNAEPQDVVGYRCDLVAPPSTNIFTGGTRVFLVARREPGTSTSVRGYISAAYKDFWITTYSYSA